MFDLLLLLVALAAGLALQRLPQSGRLRDLLWLGSFWIVIPVLVFSVFLTEHFRRDLLLALALVITASWTVLGLSYLYARLVADERDERGALMLGAGFGNTGFIAFPLAQLLYGASGLRLAVLYDQLSFGVPMVAISTTIARLHGRRGRAENESTLATVAMNPPLWALAAALLLRAGQVDVPHVDDLESVAAAIVGPYGFLMLGLALPLEAIEHAFEEVARAVGAITIRSGVAPLVLLLLATATGVDVPRTFFLMAAMPSAFHLLVLARVYDVRPTLMRLLVVGSTVTALTGILIASRF